MKLATASLGKAAVVDRIRTERAVAVIRTDSVERALGAAEAVIAAGFHIIEITFSFADATVAISKLAQNNERDLLIGAGTILTRDHVHEAVEAGARFLVSPCVLPEVMTSRMSFRSRLFPALLHRRRFTRPIHSAPTL